MQKKFFTTIVCLLFSISGIFAYSGGNGTAATPYLISSKADMTELATNVSSGQTYSGAYFKLTCDLTGTANKISTIIGGTFSGIFDGSGYKIELNISSTNNYVGLFVIISNAKIKNLGISGTVTKTSTTSTAYVGGICGCASGGNSITNCYNTANITVSSSGSSYYAGGICGYSNSSSSKNDSINNCYNTGNISSSGGSSSSGYYSGGGICGVATGYTAIRYCYNTGNISTSNNVTSSTNTYSGGICGRYGNIQNCFVADCQITNVNDATRSGIGRIGGSGSTYTKNYAEGMSTKLNDNAISSSNANSKDGKDAATENFTDQEWLQTNLSWSFTDGWVMLGNGQYPQLQCVGCQALSPNVTVTAGSNNATLGTTLGSGTYSRNSSVKLYAIAFANNVFVNWSDGNTNNPCTIIADDDITLTAIFASCDNIALLNEIAELKADTALLNSQITNLQNQLTTCNNNNTTLQGQITTLTSELSTCNTSLTTCNNNNTALQGQITTLTSELSTCNTSLTTCNNNNTNDLYAQILELQSDLTNCSSSLITCNSNNTILQGQVTTLTNNLSTCNSSLTTCNSNNTTLQGQVTTLTNNLSTCNTSLTTCNSNNTILQGQLGDCNTDKANLEALLNECLSLGVPSVQGVSLKIYPNPVPTNGVLHIENEALKSGDKIEIFTMSGGLVSTHFATGTESSINIGNLPQGTYLLRLAGKNGVKFEVK